jgi:hypothetical protein
MCQPVSVCEQATRFGACGDAGAYQCWSCRGRS